MQPTSRSGAVDALRVAGVVAVVAGHVWVNELTVMALYPWHVPLFFVLTGYFWKPGRGLVAELRSRFRTLARPYLLWLAVVLAVWVGQNIAVADLTAGDLLWPVYGGAHALRPFSAFWFVTVLFFTALAYRALEQVPSPARWAVICSGVVAGAVAGPLLAHTPLGVGSAWPCLVFLAAGAGFRRIEPEVRARSATGVALVAAGVVLVVLGLSAPLDIKQGGYGTPVLSVVVAVSICCGLILLAHRVFAAASVAANRAATLLARAGLVVVLAHAVPLMMLGTTAAGGVVDFLVALVLPWSVGLVALRTRWSSWVTGVDRPRNDTALTTQA